MINLKKTPRHKRKTWLALFMVMAHFSRPKIRKAIIKYLIRGFSFIQQTLSIFPIPGL